MYENIIFNEQRNSSDDTPLFLCRHNSLSSFTEVPIKKSLYSRSGSAPACGQKSISQDRCNHSENIATLMPECFTKTVSPTVSSKSDSIIEDISVICTNTVPLVDNDSYLINNRADTAPDISTSEKNEVFPITSLFIKDHSNLVLENEETKMKRIFTSGETIWDTPHPSPDQLNTFELNEKWYMHQYHVIVFTETGKPVFSRHGEAFAVNRLTGAMSALFEHFKVAFHRDGNKKNDNLENDELLLISRHTSSKITICSPLTICFLKKGSLIFMGISRVPNQTPFLLFTGLNRIYLQIISILTNSVHKSLECRPAFDLQAVLTPVDIAMLRCVASRQQRSLSICLYAVDTLPIHPTYRYIASCAIRAIRAPEPLLAGIIFAGSRLVALSLSSYLDVNYLSAEDLSCITALLMTAKSMRRSQNWLPICLPFFNSRSFVTMYVKYIEDPIAIVYLSCSGAPEQFHAISTYCDTKCEPILNRSGCLHAILDSLECCPYTLPYDICQPSCLLHVAYSVSKIHLMPETALDLQKARASVCVPDFYRSRSRPERLLSLPETILSNKSMWGTSNDFSEFKIPELFSPLRNPDEVLTDSNSVNYNFRQHRHSAPNITNVTSKPTIKPARLRQVFSSALMNPLDSQRANKHKKMKRILRLYKLASSLAEDVKAATPVQILLSSRHERVFCVLSDTTKVFCCIPRWADIPKDVFRPLFHWLQQQEPYIFVPVSYLTHFH